MKLKITLIISVLFFLFNCKQKLEKTTNGINQKTEIITQQKLGLRDHKNVISKFTMNFSPKGPHALDSIPESIVKDFRELRNIDKNAHKKYVTLIFIKLYAEHLSCCHQSYIIEKFPTNRSEYNFNKLTMVNEFAFMSNYLDNEKFPEIWTSEIINKWLFENPELLNYEPIGKYHQFIKTVSKKIKNGDYWENK
jgi:hypothetical protein